VISFRAAFVTCCTVVAGLLGTTAATQAAVPSAVPPAAPTFMYLAGFSQHHGLIINDFGNSRILSVRPDGSQLRVLHTDAQATEVVGGLVEYFRPSDDSASDRSYFFDLDNGRHGVVPTSWMSLTVGGGVRVARHHDGWHLYYEPDTGAAERDFGVMTDLPNVHPMFFNFGASERGLLVIGSFNSNRPAMTEFYPTPNARQHHRLNTHGIPRDTFMLCPHVATAIGCTDDDAGTQVIGLSVHAQRKPMVRQVPTAVGDVVVVKPAAGRRYAYTSLDASDPDNGPQCPCRVHFDNGAVVGGIADPAVMSDDAAYPSAFYVKNTPTGSAVFRSHFGRGRPAVILRAPRVLP
jgi:hypothetical protein